MNANNRISTASLFRTLQYFTAAFSVVVMVYTVAGQSAEHILSLLPVALLFLLCNAVCYRVKFIPLLVLTGIAAVAAGVLVPTLFWDKLTCTLLALLGYIAALLERRLRSDRGRMLPNFFLSLRWMAVPLGLFLFCSLAELYTCTHRLFVCNVVFVPLVVGEYLNERIELGLSAFESRSTQPLESVKTRMRPISLLTVTLTALGAMLVPYNDGRSVLTLLIGAIKDILLIVFGGIGKLFSLLLTESAVDGEIVTEDLVQEGTPNMAQESIANEIILAVLSVVVLSVLAYVIISRLVRLVIFLAKKYAELLRLRRAMVGEQTLSEYDTAELLDPSELKRSRPKRTLVLTNEEKLRRCYKKKVQQLAGRYGLRLTGSETPDELAAMVGEKGCDISALTALYKKARYSHGCTAEELREARRLARADGASQ